MFATFDGVGILQGMLVDPSRSFLPLVYIPLPPPERVSSHRFALLPLRVLSMPFPQEMEAQL